VFDLWLSHGLVPFTGNGSSNDAVQLATPKWGEAAVFAETEGLGLGWDKLAEVQVPVGFVMAGDATATDGEETTREMVWRPPFCANERFMDAGHLVSDLAGYGLTMLALLWSPGREPRSLLASR
jgi:hypothetical protein